MERTPNDGLIGLAVVAAAGLVIWNVFGLSVLLWIFSLLLWGIAVLKLWSSKFVAAKVLAVILMPAILLVYLTPKNTGRLPHATSRRDRGSGNDRS